MTRIIDFSDSFTSDNAPSGLTASADSFASFVDDAAFVTAKGGVATADDAYYNTTLNLVRVYNGSDWVSQVDESTAQTITNKVIDADNNTISNLAHGSEVDQPTAAHGVTEILGASEVQTVTNKVIDADNNTISNLAHGAEVDNPTAAHGVGEIVGTTEVQTLTNKTLTDCILNGTVTGVTSTDLNVSDSNIVVNKGGNEATADANIAGFTIEMSDATDLEFGYDSSLQSRIKVDGKEIATVSDIQDFTNKSIQSPSRLDVKKDTEANLTTYASTAANGQICFATDTKVMYQVVDSALAEVGSGGVGSTSIYGLVDDSVKATDWTVTGSAAVAENSTTPLSGNYDFKLTYTATAEKARTPVQLLQPRSNEANTTHEIKGVFKATGTSGAEYIIRALDQANAQVGNDLIITFDGGSNPTIGDTIPFNLLFNVTNSETSIKLEIECNSFTAGDLAYVTDIVFDDDAFSTQGLVTRESFVATNQALFWDATGDEKNWDTSLLTPAISTSSLLSIDETTDPTQTRIVAKKKLNIAVNLTGLPAAGTNLNIYNSSDLVITASNSSLANYTQSVGATLELEAGDYIYVGSANISNVIGGISFTATADSDHVIRSEENFAPIRYYKTATQSISTTTLSTVNFDLKSFDDDSLVTTGGSWIWTAPKAGKIFVDAAIVLESGTVSNGSIASLQVYKNGTAINYLDLHYQQATQATSTPLHGSDSVDVLKGDQIAFVVWHNFGSSFNLAADALGRSNYASINYLSSGMPELYALPQSEQQDFHASFDASGNLVTPYNTSGITAVYTGGTHWVVTYSALGLSSVPAVFAESTSASDVVPAMAAITTTKADVYFTDISLGTKIAMPFTFKLTKSGADASHGQVYVGNVAKSQTMYIWDEKAYNVAGGTSAASGFQARDLNTWSGDSIATVTSNKVYPTTAGEYKISVSAPAYRADRHFVYLRKNGTTNIATGKSMYSWSGTDNTFNNVDVKTSHTFVAGDYFEVLHYTETSQSTDGLGVAHLVSGYPSVYTTVELEKIR